MPGRSRWLKKVTTHRVIVHKTDDSSIEGVLVRDWKDGLALRDASLLISKAQPTRMAGEVFIPREQVALVQFDG